ncbi:MAG TPA: Hsp20/alpha crystallin family protein [Candidatus Acidoferrales bacterium]|nr:Hsp20/alpha crystallin family protein [Candidatus Acidoferrales bacterium]
MNLIPRDTFFQDLFDFRRDFDQIFNRILLGRPGTREEFAPQNAFQFAPAVEVYVDKKEKKFVCHVALPGSDMNKIEITTIGDVLTIRGERKSTRVGKDVEVMHEEIVYGSFERSMTLPEGVVTEKLEAEYKDGVLEITAPIASAALPHKVEIKTLPMTKKAAA